MYGEDSWEGGQTQCVVLSLVSLPSRLSLPTSPSLPSAGCRPVVAWSSLLLFWHLPRTVSWLWSSPTILHSDRLYCFSFPAPRTTLRQDGGLESTGPASAVRQREALRQSVVSRAVVGDCVQWAKQRLPPRDFSSLPGRLSTSWKKVSIVPLWKFVGECCCKLRVTNLILEKLRAGVHQ